MVTTVNLVSYYKCDENAANTTVVDSHGSNTGTATTNTSNLSVPGIINTAFSFNGTNEGVDLTTGFNPSTGDFSISFWIDSTVEGKVIFDNRETSSPFKGIFIGLKIGGTLSTQLNDTSVHSYQPSWTVDLGDGNPHHILLVADRTGDTYKYYIDGVLEDTINISATSGSISSTNPMLMGLSALDTNDDFNGLIDETGFWNRTLTLTDAQDLYNSGNGLAYPFSAATLRLIKISGTFQAKPILTKVAGTFVDKPIKIKIGGTFQDA